MKSYNSKNKLPDEMQERMKQYNTDLPEFGLTKTKSGIPRVKIGCSRDSAEYIYKFYGSDIEIIESFFVLMLNNSNNTVGYVKISTGGITGTLVDIRVLAHYAVQSFAVGVILAHNHPSGTLKPSEADKSLTRKIKNGLELLDIKVLDHIILAPKLDDVAEWDTPGYFSFADENLI
jgi:DNA repair protein RadC